MADDKKQSMSERAAKFAEEKAAAEAGGEPEAEHHSLAGGGDFISLGGGMVKRVTPKVEQ